MRRREDEYSEGSGGETTQQSDGQNRLEDGVGVRTRTKPSGEGGSCVSDPGEVPALCRRGAAGANRGWA